MVVGVGIDIVSVDRIEAAVRRRPRILERLFRSEERERSDVRSLAVRFAAKEAARKALGRRLSGTLWRDVYVVGGHGTAPRLVLEGTMLRAAQTLGVTAVHVSLSHEGKMAVAMVVMEG